MKKLFKTFLGFFRRKPKINIEPKLLEFLKDKGVLEEFIKNCISDYNMKHLVDVREVKFDSILSAFGWTCTPQGARYWNKLDNEFRENNLKTNNYDKN
jgi:hypothetical protein